MRGGDTAINIELNSLPKQGRLCLRFSDNGPGISSGNAQQVFEPFFTTARDLGGTGLGLAVMKSLIEAHRGSVRLMTLTKGAGFEIELPLANGSAA